MADESKKPICPNCGKEAKCFHGYRDEWFSRFDDYTLWCPHCNCRATETKHGGYTFLVWGIHLATTCPFCGKPPGEHAKGASFKEVLAGLEERREEVPPALDPEADVCPKCGKGEVICTYLSDQGAVDHYWTWRHTCTVCDHHEEFVQQECEGYETGPDDRSAGKTGGCPGPHK